MQEEQQQQQPMVCIKGVTVATGGGYTVKPLNISQPTPKAETNKEHEVTNFYSEEHTLNNV